MTRSRKAHIAGIGETRYARWGKIGDVTEHALALEAITRAVADAGLAIDDVDGLASFADDRNEAIYLAAELGLPALRFGNMVWMPGGGGGCAAVGNAAMAVETGQAEVVVVYRSLCQGQFFRFGSGGLDASAPVAAPPKPTVNQTGSLMMAWMAFAMPYGLIQAAAAYALPTRRHMHLYGTSSEQLGRIAVTFREHASRNPRAVMGNKPMTLADHQASPMIADPHRLFDCCLESDGACEELARRLYAKAGVGPGDVDVAQIYDHFTGCVLMKLEDYGFCKRGEGGPFIDSGALAWPNGSLPTNTHGGSLSEAYIHGLNHVVEGVRALRGDSANPVEGAEVCLVTSAACVPSSAVMLGRR